ncbi:Glutamyl-tRNA synthetase [Mactra antiquata]
MALPMKMKQILRIRSTYCAYRRLLHDGNVRVRFAPSPTGMLHLGGLRTALFNFLFAKSHNGKFVLRLEDTDRDRIVPGAGEKIEIMLQWAGLPPDESPTLDGPYGPYKQSLRYDLYHKNVEKLLHSGHCYHCFCTERRLNLLRKDAASRGEVPRYDNKCRHLTQSEVDEKLSQNIPFVIRFKYEPLESAWEDMVYGTMHEGAVGESLEGDFIVIKSDGYPTYHFANVVDDHYMKISHVLRGEEWSISTPKHIQLYKAFGWNSPQYAHLPLILNSDGTKLSKRQGDINVESMKDNHYDPNAILNYLTTINKGFIEDTAGMTVTDMIKVFSLQTVNTHSSRLQPQKLLQLNKIHLRRRFNSDQRIDVIHEVKDLLVQHFADRVQNSHVLEDTYIEKVLCWGMETRLYVVTDILSEPLQFIWLVPNRDNVQTVISKVNNFKEILQKTVDKLNLMTHFDESSIKEVLACYCEENKIKKKEYMGLLRNCLSELKQGPAVSEMMEILGREETLNRLNNALTLTS